MDKETCELLRERIENKNYFGVEELVSKQAMAPTLRELFLRLPELFGSLDEIRTIKSLVTNRRSLAAIERLEEVQEILEAYGLSEYVSYDLGMLSKYRYYTGIIFKAYTYGTGEYIVNGGRYDKLLEQFGKDVPAVGFAIVIDRLMMVMDRQKIPVDTGTQVTAVAMDGEADREKWQQLALKRGFCGVVTAHSKSGETGSGAAMY